MFDGYVGEKYLSDFGKKLLFGVLFLVSYQREKKFGTIWLVELSLIGKNRWYANESLLLSRKIV